MRIVARARTDTGRVRRNNEDGFPVIGRLFAVADGMGGMKAGEVAAGLALDTLRELGDRGPAWEHLPDWVRDANRRIFEKASDDRSVAGMGTTITAVAAGEGFVRIAHMGDSRAYLLRGGSLRRLTDDHTWVHRMVEEGSLTEGEARTHPDRGILSRSLGARRDVEVDDLEVEVEEGDRLMLCTDGLTGLVSEAEVRQILAGTADPQRACDLLVDAANAAGGHDNVTVVLLDISRMAPGTPAGTTRSRSRKAARGGVFTGAHRLLRSLGRRHGVPVEGPLERPSGAAFADRAGGDGSIHIRSLSDRPMTPR